MRGTILLTVSALVYTISTTIIFFKKDTINKLENRIFKRLLLVTILSMVIELSIVATVNLGKIATLVQKAFLVCLVLWLSVFMLYTFYVTIFDEKKTEEENITKYRFLHLVFIIINILLYVLIFLLPMDFISLSDDVKYTTGPAVNVVFLTLGVYTTTMSVMVLTHLKKVHNKGYIPIIALIICLIAEGFIQNTYPEILLANAVFGFIIYLMYHTIENPDVKMLDELERNKELIESSNEEKSNLMFKISQDIRKPLADIESISYDMVNSKKKEELINSAKIINNESKNTSFIVNNLLNISSMNINNIKLYKNVINLKKLLDEIKLMFSNVNVEINMMGNIPTIYGDSVRFKQILASIINNSINVYSKNITIEVNGIIRYDMCRLLINVIDDGDNLDIFEINEILSSKDNEEDISTELDLNLKSVYSLVSILNGSMNIKHNKDNGNTYSIVLDTEIPKKNREVLNIDYSSKKKVLIIDDNYDEIKEYSKIIRSRDIKVSNSMYANDIFNRFNNGETFDIILIDDEMKPTNAVEIIDSIKALNVKSVLVIMLESNKEKIKDKYLKDYKIDDYLLKSNYEEEIDRIINKYL